MTSPAPASVQPVGILPDAASGSTRRPRHGQGAAGACLVRQTVDFLVTLCLSILLFRTFAAEAYVVPTGSMAPTLLGVHKEIVCPNCGYRFSIGMDEQGQTGRPVCLNCGQPELDGALTFACSGDRLLVQKFLFDIRPPRRWEVAVFHSPAEPTQAYVKRVVGLPGEAVLVSGGNVVVNGHVARKSLAEQRAMRILVFDNNFRPRDADRYPRFEFRRRPVKGLFRVLDQASQATGWKVEGRQFLHEPTAGDVDLIDWIDYRHWDPERGYGPIRDFCPYNGATYRSENTVGDVMLEAQVAPAPDTRAVLLRLQGLSDRFLVTIPVDDQAAVEVRRNGRTLPLGSAGPGLKTRQAGGTGKPAHIEASLMDQRLLVAIDGQPLFDPIDFDDPGVGSSPSTRSLGPHFSPVGLGVLGGSCAVSDVRIYRDVYYTSALSNSPRRPFGVDSPYQLHEGEFFVLGDNSPVSNDSRFWPNSPVVRSELFLGKPFLVHLPSQGFPLKVFGRELYWVPDPREIRYIR